MGLDAVDGAELSLWLQKQTATCARLLGYAGCIMTDEQGTLYMIDMFGREADMQIH